MPGLLRSLIDRLLGRRRPPPDVSPPAGAGTPQVDIVLSDLPRDWVESLESRGPSTDYDVRSLGEPIDPTSRR